MTEVEEDLSGHRTKIAELDPIGFFLACMGTKHTQSSGAPMMGGAAARQKNVR